MDRSSIEHFMTSVLHVAATSDSVADVAGRMRRNGMRHMPIVRGQEVVGLVSLRDLEVLEVLRDVDPTDLFVERVMIRAPYVVEPDEPAEIVAARMAELHIGAAVVVHGRQLRGLFTTTDALLALAARLRAERVPDVDDEDELI